MLDLSEKICQINGVIGAAVNDERNVVIALTCLSETAQRVLEEMAVSAQKMLSACETYAPGVKSLSAKGKEYTLLTRLYPPWCISALCQNDQILFLLESAIEALAADYLHRLAPAVQRPGHVWLRPTKRAEELQPLGSPLCEEIIKRARPFFAQAHTAERLILRQIREHLKLRPEDLNHTHLSELTRWVTSSAALLLDERSVHELGWRIYEIN